MVGLAAPLLLLAMTLALLGPPAVQAAQSGQSQVEGESKLPLDEESRAPAPAAPSTPAESVLVSVYVHLAFSSKTWPPELPLTLAPPSAWTSSSPTSLTGLNLTTVCHARKDGHFCCECLPGYQWNASVCSHRSPCPDPHSHQPCVCLVFSHPEPAYCQLLPPVPGMLSLGSRLPKPGSTLNLTLLLHHTATDLSWLLWPIGHSHPVSLQPGTQVSLSSPHQGQAALSIFNVSQEWAGEYMCCFEARGFRWELHQEVRVPLQEADVAGLPDQLSISCATAAGLRLSCCTPSTHLSYTASWSPGEGSTVSLLQASGSQCLMLAAPDCPAANTTYTCELRSPETAPLRVSVSVTTIQDGDTVCSTEFLVVDWEVTKAGYMAQAPCPQHRLGRMTRLCQSDGSWGPVHSSCMDAGLLALLHRARLLPAGQGYPAEEVPHLLGQLPEQAARVRSPSDLLALLGTMTILAEVVAEGRIHLAHSDLKALLTATDKVLAMDNSSLWTSTQAQEPLAASALLRAVETLARSLHPKDHPSSFILPNMQLQSQLLGPTDPEDYRVSFSTQPPLQAQIPRRSLAPLDHNRANVSITSLVLQRLDRLLPSNYGPGLGDSVYASPGLVLSISITADGQAINQGQVIMDFGDRSGIPHCVFWDPELFHGEGGWSDEGCQARVARASPTAQCVCQHLTAFSILMSRHTVPDSPALELLSQLGLGASILALLVCLGVYRLVWRAVVRNKVAYFRHIALLNVVLCLLAADTCFLGAPFLPAGPQSPLCLAAAFLCHFLYLATFFWMLAQALMLAHQLLFVFHQLSKHWVLPLMVALGYLCPLGFAGGALVLYLPRGKYLREGACWLDGKGGVLYTFAVPVLVIVGVNGLVLVMAVLKLLRPSLSEGLQVEKRQALLGVIKALLILTPIFGLTWGLSLATLIEEVSDAPHYIFTILNTAQGVFILLFGCLMDKKVQEALRRRFCHRQPPGSTISLATNETFISEQSKGRRTSPSYAERTT
ncbi:adhesion G-protein coupled receptor F3 [Echinops telfairi]|uniref:Adhesion G-protein coupled receptor F3 n=1 Tax=Echinops telfairi TaxID=9371 RepID=A0AC55CSQ5_ECHTE|nr:adhesion G-protein coupled receptor F3 [Echinops telfairi]